MKHNLGPGLVVRAASNRGSAAIGLILCSPLGVDRTELRVPKGRGSRNQAAAYELDPQGDIFWSFLQSAISELKRKGYISAGSRFAAAEVLESATRQLASSEDSPGYASIGNSCRAALIALANELYKPYMLPPEEKSPYGDDAKTKLKHVASHYKGAQRGLNNVINGVWGFSQDITHSHKNAVREDAEMCVILTKAVFDFSL